MTNKTKSFPFPLVGLLGTLLLLFQLSNSNVVPSGPHLNNPNTPNQPAEPVIPVDPELRDVQVPVPRDCRVFNKSGNQCVWCSIELLARYHKVTALYDLTQHYKHVSGPLEVNSVLTNKYPTVKWKQINTKDIDFIKKYVTEQKLGVGIAIPGHMLNLVHYDDAAKIVKVIDNSDHSLKIQTWSMEKFNSMWDGWALVIFPTTD